ncbi:MAG TPA: VCBS repeat-containing protein [Terriglobia bacterium]|nr:VCBS repeat-containing protein [Terriglobia bacterium]
MKHRFLIVCTLIIWLLESAAQTPLFVSGAPVTVAGGTGYVGLHDLNRDGHLDLVSSSRSSGRPDVRLGDGRGGFVSSSQSDFGIKHAAIAFGDVNGDGILDCSQADRDMTNEYIHVFFGSGDGKFVTANNVRLVANRSVSLYKPQIWFLDVNEDRKTDLVTQNGRRNTVEIFAGDGRGGFAPAKVVSIDPGFNFYTTAFGDVDRDGHLDMVIAMSPHSEREPGRIRVYAGNGSGDFSRALGEPLAAESRPSIAALEDVNGDTRLDVVLSHGETALLTILSGESNGRFAKPMTFPLESGHSAFTVIVRDVNRDRRADLVLATVNSESRPYNSGVVVLLGNGSTFTPATGSPFRVGPGAYRAAMGDINEDGALDIATSSFEGDNITVMLGR